MKDNTQQTKALLQRALVETPQDYALTDVRYHIRAALAKLEAVEQKRERREVAAERRAEAIKGKTAVGAYDPLRAIQAIDEMIAEEKANIAEIQRRRAQSGEQKDDGDELQTVFG